MCVYILLACTNGTCVFLLARVWVLPNKRHQKGRKTTEPKQISQQFEGQNTAGHDLRRLSLSQAPCLGAPDNISALLSPRFYCERLQIHLPNNAPIHHAQPLGPHFAHMASEVPLDTENKAEMFGSHVPRFILMPPTSQILLVCDALGHLRAGQPRGGQHFRVPRRLNLPDSAD